jgi:hypothetical protein
MHPDADTLTAYVEQLLPAGERHQVVEHLAGCAFCREVVAVRLPSLPEEMAVHSLPASSRFWKFGFRWAGALAVLAIAVALAVVYRPANKDLAQNPVAKTPEPHATEASTAKTSADSVITERPSVLPDSETLRTRSAPPSIAPPPTIGRLSGGLSNLPATTQSAHGQHREDVPRNEAQNADLKDSVNLNSTLALRPVLESNPQPKPASQNREHLNSLFFSAEERSSTFDYTSSYRDARQEQARINADREKKQITLGLATPNSEQDANPHKGFLRKALPIGPLAASVMGTLKSAAARPSVASDALASEKGSTSSFAGAAPVRPPISARQVTGTAAAITHEPPDPRRTRTASADQLHWRVQDGKLVNSADLSQWHEAYPPQGDEIQFKVVQAQGHEVWAGGTNATLVHSWNGGVDWQKLSLGDAASGDIEKISLSGGDVQVKTSNGQHLISRDGGKTWAPLNADSNPSQPNQPK